MAAWWRSVSLRVKGLVVIALAVVSASIVFAVVSALTFEYEAEAGLSHNEGWKERLKQAREKHESERIERDRLREKRSRERQEKWARIDQENEKYRVEFEVSLAKQPHPKRKKRRIRRFVWESPAEIRGRIWNVPVEETHDALVTALLRVSIAEADGNPQDTTGIWQVVKNNRQRSCRRGVVRRITECEEGGGETHLSSLRRHQRHALGYIKARNKRALWIRNLTPDCEVPVKGWPHSENRWDARYGSKICPQVVADAKRLIAGKLPEQRPGQRSRWIPGRPITWGGRCESGKASCDDRIACERVLARIPNVDAHNAFWCRVGAPGCSPDPEPICVALGYQYEQVEYKNRVVWKLRTVPPPKAVAERIKNSIDEKRASQNKNEESLDIKGG